MEKIKRSAQETTDVRKLYAAINRTPQDKQTIIKVLAETFASGMATQAALTASSAPAAR